MTDSKFHRDPTQLLVAGQLVKLAEEKAMTESLESFYRRMCTKHPDWFPELLRRVETKEDAAKQSAMYDKMEQGSPIGKGKKP